MEEGEEIEEPNKRWWEEEKEIREMDVDGYGGIGDRMHVQLIDEK